ncbi:MAG: molybdopterin synthase catalytic subunit [Oleispira sp.]
MISVQTEDFDFANEYLQLRERSLQSGAIVMFVGLVRDFSDNTQVNSMALEHYPGMTENVLNSIVQQAEQRWPLEGIRIIHRIGELHATDQIVLVGVSSAHRISAYEASQFIMDSLKTEAPFWKKESTQDTQGSAGERWVDAKNSDSQQAADWHTPQE